MPPEGDAAGECELLAYLERVAGLVGEPPPFEMHEHQQAVRPLAVGEGRATVVKPALDPA